MRSSLMSGFQLAVNYWFDLVLQGMGGSIRDWIYDFLEKKGIRRDDILKSLESRRLGFTRRGYCLVSLPYKRHDGPYVFGLLQRLYPEPPCLPRHFEGLPPNSFFSSVWSFPPPSKEQSHLLRGSR